MTRILISVLPFTRGDINPYLALTRALAHAGHEVCWIALPEPLGDFAHLVAAAGAMICDSPPSPAPGLPRGTALAAILADQADYARRIRLPLAAACAQVEHVRGVLRAHRIDVVASDRALELAPVQIAAALEAVPHAFVCAGLHLVLPGDPPASAAAHAAGLRRWIELRALFKHHQLAVPTWGSQLISPQLNTCFTTATCVGEVALPPHTALVGPCVDQHAADAGDPLPGHRLRGDGRIVYVSFGSLYADAAIYHQIAAAAAPLDVQLVVATGPLEPAAVRDLAGDVIALAHVPQRAVLARARAFVSHGGFNSFNEAVLHGVPMIVVPRAVDQRLQARLARRCGIGIAFDDTPVTVPALRAALIALLDPASPARAACERIRASYQARNGAHEVRDRLIALAAAR